MAGRNSKTVLMTALAEVSAMTVIMRNYCAVIEADLSISSTHLVERIIVQYKIAKIELTIQHNLKH